MDNLAEHGIAGMVGLLFNGLFAADYIIGGWLNHNYKQLYIQFAYIVACTAYSFVVSALIASLINLVPCLKLRASEEAELLGLDDDQLGEFAYDYVEVRRDYFAWTPERGGGDRDRDENQLRLCGWGMEVRKRGWRRIRESRWFKGRVGMSILLKGQVVI
jgi:hypothetical protein